MKAILAVILILAATVDLRAAAAWSGSLEWFTDTSQAIGIYTVSSVESRASGSGAHYAFDLDLKESLKGKPQAIAKVTYDDFYYLRNDKTVAKGDRFLVFFWTSKNQAMAKIQAVSLTHPAGVVDTPMALAMNARLEEIKDGVRCSASCASDWCRIRPGTRGRFPARKWRFQTRMLSTGSPTGTLIT